MEINELYGDADSAVEIIEKLARSQGPDDPITRAAYQLQKILIIPFLPLNLFATSFNGLLSFRNYITLGILFWPFLWAWLPVQDFLEGSSWLWLNLPPLRPILILPGLSGATLGFVLVSFLPKFGDQDFKQYLVSLCKCWPHAFLIKRLGEDDILDNAD